MQIKPIGWIAVHRKIASHWIWKDKIKRCRWLDLLMLAEWEPITTRYGKHKIFVDRGQVAVTIRSLMHFWKTNNRVVKEFLQTLIDEKMIEVEKESGLTIITICNYDQYQKMPDGEVQNDPSFSTEMNTTRLQKRTHERLTIEQDNNIINKNNQSQQSVREENLKFFEEMKKAEISLDEMAMRFSCSKQELLEMLDAFVKEVNIKETRHTDFSDFRKHFFDWARIQFDKKREYENRRNKSKGGSGGSAQDKYAARRGTDVGGKSESDYGSSF